MPVPGYDPEDLDAQLESQLSEREIKTHLTEEQFGEYQEGANLTDLLGEEDIQELL